MLLPGPVQVNAVHPNSGLGKDTTGVGRSSVVGGLL